MSYTPYFVQECPTCGRRLLIRVEYLGKGLVCQHCQGRFTALDHTNACLDYDEPSSQLLRRADELLQTVANQRAKTPAHYPR